VPFDLTSHLDFLQAEEAVHQQQILRDRTPSTLPLNNPSYVQIMIPSAEKSFHNHAFLRGVCCSQFCPSCVCKPELLIIPEADFYHYFYRSLSQLPVQSLSLVGSGVICANIPGLMARQRLLCRENPDVMLSVVHGAKKGVRQCQKQFRSHKWNCSVSHTDSSVFGKLMLKGSSSLASQGPR
jgi:hypothetical protein